MTYLVSNHFTKLFKFILIPLIIILQILFIVLMVSLDSVGVLEIFILLFMVLYCYFFLIYPLATSQIIKYQSDNKSILVGSEERKISLGDIQGIEKYRIAFFKIVIHDIEKPIVFLGDIKMYYRYSSGYDLEELLKG